MKALLNLCLLIFPLFALAERNESIRDSLGAVSGIVFTADGQPATSVTVGIKKISKETITDAAGKFEINKLKPGIYILSVSLTGYKSIEFSIDVKQNETTFLKIPLQVTFVELTNINLKTNPVLKYVETKPSESLRLNLPLIEIPQNIAIIDQQLLTDQGLFSMPEAIRNVSGIQKIFGGLNDYSLNIRGTDATWNVFRNGIGGYWWNQQEDVAMLEKIEFVKGPAGFMISMAEPGGVINNVTKQPTKEPIASINVGFGSYQLHRLTADFGGKLNKSATFSYRLNAGVQNQQRAFQFGTASRYFICAALKYALNEKTSLTAEYNNMFATSLANNDGLPSEYGKLFVLPLNFSIADADSYRKTAMDKSYRIQLKHSFSNNWHLNAQAGYVHGKLGGYMLGSNDIPIINDTFYRSANFDDWHNYVGVVQTFVDGKFYTGKKFEHKVLIGLDYANTGSTDASGDTWGEKKYGLYLPNPQYFISQDSLRNFVINPVANYYLKWIALYLQDHIKIGGKLVVTLAGHFTHTSERISNNGNADKNKTGYNRFTPRAGLTWLFSENLSAYTLYDQCFLPQFGKLFFPQPVKPLTGHDIEGGIKSFFFNKKFGLNLSCYSIVKNHTLTQDPEHPDYVIERGQITSRGIDLDLNGNITPAFNVNVNYSYTDAKITKDADPQNVGVPNFGSVLFSGDLI